MNAHRLIPSSGTVLLAVSGGKDSVALCHLFREAGYPFAIAHCNFRLRGGESERDEDFVTALARHYEVPFHHIAFDTTAYAAARRLTIQEACRQLRYEWFERVRQENGYSCIATAQHRDDSVETLLLNFFKGTGMAGLHGILPRQGHVIRPLLFAPVGEIKAYLEEKELSYVEDSSNSSDKYTRNYIRHQVVPVLKKAFPEVEKNLAANTRRFREAELLYRDAVERLRKKLLRRKGEEHFVPVRLLQQQEALHTLCYELFQEFCFSPEQAVQIAGLLDSGPGKTVASSTHRVLRDRDWLIVTPLKSAAAVHHLIEKLPALMVTDTGTFYFESLPVSALTPSGVKAETTAGAGVVLPADPDIALLDAAHIRFPLLLRPWQQGDYFYPLGMRKKKKLSRFFIDRKLPLTEKEKIRVVESGGRIIWIAGQRIDDRFKVTEHTRSLLKITRRPDQERK
ncbi:tRNA lysidine(34) synthetase TilS [Compostibacter hankyongensis]|uniref:tRNA lysidine(34) synthetase TilS n=1 Tax=Compostibacter hankyongensis TaxID=1007089 RepID=UPI0031E8B076